MKKQDEKITLNALNLDDFENYEDMVNFYLFMNSESLEAYRRKYPGSSVYYSPVFGSFIIIYDGAPSYIKAEPRNGRGLYFTEHANRYGLFSTVGCYYRFMNY